MKHFNKGDKVKVLYMGNWVDGVYLKLRQLPASKHVVSTLHTVDIIERGHEIELWLQHDYEIVPHDTKATEIRCFDCGGHGANARGESCQYCNGTGQVMVRVQP